MQKYNDLSNNNKFSQPFNYYFDCLNVVFMNVKGIKKHIPRCPRRVSRNAKQ